MPDFLDRYGAQLQLAQRRARRRSRILRRGGLASLLVIAVAVPATAVVQPWTPRLGRPDKGMAATIDRRPVEKSAVEQLAVLRRPQTARDRRLAAPRLRNAGGRAQGVQVDAVRALTKDYALVPIAKFEPMTGDARGPMLCIMGGGGSSCGPVSNLATVGIGLIKGGAGYGTTWAGIVPDGVAQVRFTPVGAAPVTVDVRDNFFLVHVDLESAPGRFTPPTGYKGTTAPDGTISDGGGPVHGELEWLDAAGRVVGPER